MCTVSLVGLCSSISELGYPSLCLSTSLLYMCGYMLARSFAVVCYLLCLWCLLCCYAACCIGFVVLHIISICLNVVVSVYSLFFTAAYTIDVLDDENVYNFSMSSFVDYIPMLFLIPVLYFTILSFASCVRCFLPRLKESALKSPLFFGDIYMDYKDFNEYHPKFKELRDNPDDYQKHLTHMVYVTGNIAFTKFLHVNKAIKSLIRSVIFFVCYIACFYLIQFLIN